MNRPFKDWKIEEYTMISPDEKYELWICNGFFFFEDYAYALNFRKPKREPLLRGLGIIDRFKLWMEYKKELKIRLREKLKFLKPICEKNLKDLYKN